MKILILLSRIPYRLEKGDKLRAFYQIKELAKNHELILFALTDCPAEIPAATDALKKYCSQVYLFPVSKGQSYAALARSATNAKPAQVNYFYHTAAQTQLNQIIQKHQPDHIYCQLVRMTEYVRHIMHIPKTLDYMDALSKGVDRRYEIAPFYLKQIYRLEAGRLKKYEAAVFNDFELKTIISRQDRDLINHPERHKIEIIPNGIDLEFFQPIALDKKFELVFAGNMSYPPNVETAVFLSKKVMPLLLKTNPNARLLLAGATPNQRVMALASENVSVSGWLDDIREAYASAKIFVAPMNIGTGMQNKVLEAMAMKIPCIVSSLVNNGIGGTENEQVLVADSAEQVAAKILLLLENEAIGKQLAENAYHFVNENYNWKSAVAKLEKGMQRVSGAKLKIKN